MLNKNDILYTRYSYCNKGLLFNQQLIKAPHNEEKARIMIPAKAGIDTNKYGGYDSVKPSYFMLVESEDKKGKLIRTIESVPIYLKEMFQEDNQKLVEYCISRYGLKKPRILLPVIKKGCLISVNGFPMNLNGSTGSQLILQGAVQLCVSNTEAEYIKRLEKYESDNQTRTDKKIELKIDEYRGITNSQNEEIYDLFIRKLKNGIYSRRPANPVKKLEKSKTKFVDLSLEKQSLLLMQLLNLFKCKPLGANAEAIGEGNNMGKIKINKNITSFKEIKLINQSPTGLYENVIDLLKV